MLVYRFFPILLLLCFAASSQAAPFPSEQVPDSLKPWVDWVMWRHKDLACPVEPGDSESRRCVWIGNVALDLASAGGKFSLDARLYNEGWVALPGDKERWPLEVNIDNVVAPVVERDSVPHVWLGAGIHRVTGRFAWDKLPDTLRVPETAGIVQLTLLGKQVAIPARGQDGAIWIGGREGGLENKVIADALTARAYRRVVDGVPVRVETHLDLEVSGRQREVVLRGALLDGAIPLDVSGDLPARIEPDGGLRIQVRPGHWGMDIASRMPGEVFSLKRPTPAEPWPAEEIWTYQADRNVRLADVEGPASIDPRQTGLPTHWKNLPAYLMEADSTLTFKQIRRGDPEPEPDSLTLNRQIWLDFDGKGYTVNDRLGGRMTREWRLNALPGLELGSVYLGKEPNLSGISGAHYTGTPQSITKDPTTGSVGVEIRQGTLALSADSRLPGTRRFSVTGWDHRFKTLSAELNLPPGWRLVTATGVDTATGSWTEAWTLLDIFLVSIASLAVFRLWGGRWGVIALVALVLLWQEPGAPHHVWLNLLAATALIRALPDGKPKTAVKTYRILASLVLVALALPFVAEQIRMGMHPQLQIQGFTPQIANLNQMVLGDGMAENPMVGAMESELKGEPMIPAEAKGGQMPERAFKRGIAESMSSTYTSSAAPVPLRKIDTGIVTQTGPGLPEWRWTSVSLGWSGPVEPSQEVGLVLLPPAANLMLNFARVMLLGALAWLLCGGTPRRPGGGFGQLAPLGLLLLIGLPNGVKADLPTPEILSELETRLTQSEACQPECAEFSVLRLETSVSALKQVIEVDALARTAVPLPAASGQWLPATVEIDGRPGAPLLLDAEGTLWLAVEPGHHQVALSGVLPVRERIQLPLPKRPHHVTAAGEGWTVEGIREDGTPDVQLLLVRETLGEKQEPATLEPKPLPPFLKVTRTLSLDVDWRVRTTVERVSSPGVPVTLQVPLLDGEAVLSQGVRVKEGMAYLNLTGDQAVASWESSLDKRPGIVLTAPKDVGWTELWQLNAGVQWRVAAEGLAPLHHQNMAGTWIPEWLPWPGETLTLKISRPEGVPGGTLTLDGGELQVTPGTHATESTLTLRLRSSQGGKHVVKLPEGAELQSVLIDGTSQPIRSEGNAVTLPIHPGAQGVSLSWREPQGFETHFRTPRIDLGLPGVNFKTRLDPGAGRWLLALGGPTLGPAVLFWSKLGLIVILAFALGRWLKSPLKTWHWALLLMGLGQVSLASDLMVATWFMVLAWRGRHGERLGSFAFNALQVTLAVMTLMVIGILLTAVQMGLLALPNMDIVGNGSNAHHLFWYQDRFSAVPEQAWLVSVPLWGYRVLMLSWALWLAYAALHWLRWGWSAYSSHGLWRKWPIPPMKEE